MITYAPIDVAKIKNLLAELHANTAALEQFKALSLVEFQQDRRNYALAEHHFRRALEGILTIGTHFLSRLPSETKDYQEVIISLGKHGVIPEDFAAANRKLAGYRNRLVHLYWQVSQKELYEVIQQHLADLKKFAELYLEYLRRQEAKT